MADQQSRGGKKEGQNNPQTPEKHQTTTAAHQPGTDSGKKKDPDRPKPGDPNRNDAVSTD